MSKQKGVMSVRKATYMALVDACEQCRINGVQEIIHMNTFLPRARAYVNGGLGSYRPLDDNMGRRLRKLRQDGVIDYDYKDGFYTIKKINPLTNEND